MLLIQQLVRAPGLTRTLVGRGFVCALSKRDLSNMTTSQVPIAGIGDIKGGCAGGTIRESGGKWAEREAAFEEMYFRELTSYQLDHLKDHHLEEINHLEKNLKLTEETLKRHKDKLDSLKKIASQLK